MYFILNFEFKSTEFVDFIITSTHAHCSPVINGSFYYSIFVSVRTCFVTSLTRATQLEAVDPPPDVVYREGGSEVVNIPGKVREAVYEVLFEQDNDQISVSTMILDAIIKAIYFIFSSDITKYQR
jgi:hypothetical protein